MLSWPHLRPVVLAVNWIKSKLSADFIRKCPQSLCRAYGQSRGILSDLLSGFCEKFHSYHTPRLSVVYFIEMWKWYWKMITDYELGFYRL